MLMDQPIKKEKSYFWVWLAVGFVTLQLLTSTVFLFSSPPGELWLGANNQNTSDTSVYLSLLRQVSDGSFTSAQLYNAEAGTQRVFPFWVFLGLFSRLGLSPLILYELGRIIGGMCLAYTLWFAASRVFTQSRDAKLAVVLAASGVGTGWIYAAWEALTQSTPAQVILSLHSEFSVAPSLLGSGHLAISMSLLIIGLILLWERISTYSLKQSWPYLICFGVLFTIHPYLILLYSIYGALAGIYHIGWRSIISPRFILIHALSALPAFALYIPLFFDSAFRTQHTVSNDLPLPSITILLISFFPFLIAAVWRYSQKIRIQKQEVWLLVWMLSAILALLFPVPWKRKLIEGLGVCFVFLSMPVWISIRDYFLRARIPILTTSILFLLGIFSSADFIALFRSSIVWSQTQSTQKYFSAPRERFSAWEYLRTHTSLQAVIASNDIQAMLWTPAYAGRHIWLGHTHETTDYVSKHREWELFWNTTSTQQAQDIIQRAGVTHILTTQSAASEHIEKLLGWSKIFEQKNTAIFEAKKLQND